jgi:putative PIN family toxin of toxin-antitoxin system
MRVIIDTNCLIAAIPSKNPEYWLYLAFRNKAFDWCISNAIMLEYEEVIARFYSQHTADLVLNILLTASNVIKSEPFINWKLITNDPKDDKFADIAISANVNYLVTNDHDFDVLKTVPFPSVKVVSLTQFQKILGYGE